ncbi:type III PLP-dependent enzyme [Seohaeicola saemankumensis]|uniref:type III PLP-dependent enzyme n=1 Tax=Seohaeicola saemankumensis TaxID=481181 RepID=UPI001E4E6E52|nr:type III PLP-dependent enzyme [Seohaeicola saemankumensis]MCD1627850.1 type III PLP-dependent enzyme [Seohaeicola saemankumensis]
MKSDPIWSTPDDHLRKALPDTAQLYFCPAEVQRMARRFQAGFSGLVSYAVKANPAPEVLENLVAAGLHAFDVASVAEMRAVRAVCPDAVLHYNNPVRSRVEVAQAALIGIASASVDCAGELAKLAVLPRGTEISVRLALPVKGAAYDFGTKFGAGPDQAVNLLAQVAAMGFTPAMTFHPGTQCGDAGAWAAYIHACAVVAVRADVRLARLNVGGGFAAHRGGAAPDLGAVFARITQETHAAFGADAPQLVCEPGRAMVAEACQLATRVKSLRGDAVYLNDGIYGALAEWRDITGHDRLRVVTADGATRAGALVPRIVFGPTCDSIDRLPDPVLLPSDLSEEDYVIFAGMGAYGSAIATRFNGYGPDAMVTVAAFSA